MTLKRTQGTFKEARLMTKGLGRRQRRIKQMLHDAFDAELGALTWPHIRQVSVLDCGGKSGDHLHPTFERSLKRTLHALVKRGDVLIVGGKGGPGDPYCYLTVECFASAAEDREVTDTAEAKAICKELATLVMAGGEVRP